MNGTMGAILTFRPKEKERILGNKIVKKKTVFVWFLPKTGIDTGGRNPISSPKKNSSWNPKKYKTTIERVR